jgi:hypothetical protein
VGLSLLTVAVATYLFARSIGFTSKLYAVRYDAALWIASHFPPGTIFAAWNAGQLSYFSNRVFINLDGVLTMLITMSAFYGPRSAGRLPCGKQG